MMTDTVQPARTALVVGAGIAGLSAATALHNAGWSPVIVERAPARRRGGYFIAMFGSGRIAADRIGLKGLRSRAPKRATTFQIDRHGKRRAGLGFADFPQGPWMMLRGDVEQAAFDALPEDVPLRFATSPTQIVQDGDGATVTLHNTAENTATTERFDLVVGADGIRSTVRRLVFGPHEKYLRRLGYMITAFELTKPLPGLAQREGAIMSEPGRSFWVFAFEDHAPTVLFSYRTDDVDAEFTTPPADRLRAIYGPEPLGELMEAALTELDNADEYLFDSVEQVQIDRWHDGRVVLVGDAAWCPTLYSGMGATSGLAGADALGVMLSRYPNDVERALTAWEKKLRPAMDDFQKAAFPMRAIFTVNTPAEQRRQRFTIALRRLIFTVPAFTALFASSKSFRLRNSDLTA